MAQTEPLDTWNARVVSVHVGAADVLHKEARELIELQLDGIVGDRHRGFTRECWEGDKQASGTVRRNERQWSAISEEELALISQEMGLASPLQATSVGANICLSGVPGLSRLPRGTLLRFPSGAVLMVEEYNPPCLDMGERLAATCKTLSGTPLSPGDFSSAARFSRGVVGVVEVAGEVRVGDAVTIEAELLPKWLRQG